jgi:tetratricopeptide (TPR) repeat protein
MDPDSAEENDREGRGSRRKRREGDVLFGLARKEKIKRPGKKAVVQIRFHWKRVFAALGVLALAGWIACGTALYFYFKERRGYEEVSFFKMLVLPLRLDEHRREMGEFFIRRGTERIEAGEFRAGFHQLRIGLARAPADPEARILLARIFRDAYRDHRLAIKALEQGLKHAEENPSFYDHDYLHLLFFLLNESERDLRRIELAGELAEKVADPALKATLHLEAARAESELGRFADAAERLRGNGLLRSPDGFLLLARVLWRSGDRRMAILGLESGLERFPRNPRMATALLEYLAAAGRWEDLLGQARFRRAIQPDLAVAWTAVLPAFQNLGRESEVLPWARKALARFPDDQTALALLRFGVDHARPDVASLVVRESGPAVSEAAGVALLALAHLRAGEPSEALAVLAEAEGRDVELDAARLSGLRALAHRLRGNEQAAVPELQAFLENETLPASVYWSLADAFGQAGFTADADRILAAGIERFPRERKLLVRLLRREKTKAGGRDFVDYAARLVEGRVPPVPVLREIREAIVSDRYLFARGREEVVGGIDAILEQARSPFHGVAVSPASAGFPDTTNENEWEEFLRSPSANL